MVSLRMYREASPLSLVYSISFTPALLLVLLVIILHSANIMVTTVVVLVSKRNGQRNDSAALVTSHKLWQMLLIMSYSYICINTVFA
jgi:hypothetical protein